MLTSSTFPSFLPSCLVKLSSMVRLLLFVAALLSCSPCALCQLGPDYDLYNTGTPSQSVPPIPKSQFIVLMGGGTDVAEAFQAQIVAAQGGDANAKINVVILRTSGADGYNAWIMGLDPNVACVTSVVIHTRAGANSDTVNSILKQADMVFIAGGDQSTYINMSVEHIDNAAATAILIDDTDHPY
jgi:hypothetical protein